MVSAVSQATPPAADVVRAGATRRAPRAPGAGWALGAVLLVQTGLSARLAWTGTAGQDEAQYLWAGHLEWAHWLHHTPVPDFPAYLSGAPVAYPLLGALADSAGGLTAARLLSLGFMLGVTALLWATTSRLYGRRAALLASALFATLAGTQFLGSLATADGPALFLLALASWLGVRAVAGPAAARWTVGRVALLIGAGLALAAADGTKYATVLFTPVAIVVVGLAARRPKAVGVGLVSAAVVLAAWAVAVAVALLAGGRTYWRGVTATTLAPSGAGSPVATVLREAYVWTSLILVLAVLGVWLSARSRERARFLPAVLLATALLVPAAQAGRHSTDGLASHLVYGAWFAAIAAGYALARLSRVDRGYGWAAVMALPIAAATLFGSMGQAHALHRGWPDATALVRVLRPAVHTHPGSYLAEDDVPAYYLRSGVPSEVHGQDWSTTGSFRYAGRAAGAPSYAAAIARHHFALIILDFGDTPAADAQITADLRRTGGYHVLARAGRFTVWADGGGRHAGH
jgi:hypothetical protein